MHYKLRAECPADVVRFAYALGRASIDASDWTIRQQTIDGALVPDCDVVFSSPATLAELRSVIVTLEDGHVLMETIATEDHYTGIRTRDGK